MNKIHFRCGFRGEPEHHELPGLSLGGEARGSERDHESRVAKTVVGIDGDQGIEGHFVASLAQACGEDRPGPDRVIG